MSDVSRELIVLSEPAPANYSHAVRVGSQVFVAGIVSMVDGKIVGINDAAAQTRQVLANIEEALRQAGASPRDIVRYRVYITDMADLQAVRTELTQAFGSIRPAGTLVAVSALVHPDLKIEIDVDAIAGSALRAKED